MKKSELLKELECNHNKPKKSVIVFDNLHIFLCDGCITKYKDLGIKVVNKQTRHAYAHNTSDDHS